MHLLESAKEVMPAETATSLEPAYFCCFAVTAMRRLSCAMALELWLQTVRPFSSIPAYDRYMYDGELEAQMYMIFDANKHLISTADIYPEASAWPTSLHDQLRARHALAAEALSCGQWRLHHSVHDCLFVRLRWPLSAFAGSI